MGYCYSVVCCEVIVEIIDVYNILLVEDDFYCDLYYDDVVIMFIVSLLNVVFWVYMGSFLKVLWFGLWVGYVFVSLFVMLFLVKIK